MRITSRVVAPDSEDEVRPEIRSAEASTDIHEVLFRKIMGITAAAHELKTPLSILSGYTRLLLDESLGELNEQQRRVLDEMESGAARLQRFINDFLAFGALESGKFIPNLKLHDINAALGEMVQIWRPRFEGACKELIFAPAAGLPLVPFDELKIQHVLSNLLDNALKFTPEQGTVVVSTRSYFWDRRLLSRMPGGSAERRQRPLCKDNSVRVDVCDTGPGISPEDFIEVFSEFRRLHTSLKADGIGLGLAIAKRLVEAHGGKIWVESGSRPGATFSFLLATS